MKFESTPSKAKQLKLFFNHKKAKLLTELLVAYFWTWNVLWNGHIYSTLVLEAISSSALLFGTLMVLAKHYHYFQNGLGNSFSHFTI